ncbi:hypothetical protein ATANTOWER_016338, partial [Ataeniobius toweri]|nr:hypothetical protein [Ataeniobius toweri]
LAGVICQCWPDWEICVLSTDACASIAVYQGPQREQEEYSKFTIQEPKETFQTLKQLRNIMEELQRQHNSRNNITAQYGSLDNPIVGKTS